MSVIGEKHNSLQMDHLHRIIERLANNSFTIKGWAVTVASGFFGFAVKDAKPAIAFIGVIPIMIFWITDGYCLTQERDLRKMYNEALAGEPAAMLQLVGLRVYSEIGLRPWPLR